MRQTHHSQDGEIEVKVWRVGGEWCYRASRWLDDAKLTLASNLYDERGCRTARSALAECQSLHAFRGVEW